MRSSSGLICPGVDRACIEQPHGRCWQLPSSLFSMFSATNRVSSKREESFVTDLSKPATLRGGTFSGSVDAVPSELELSGFPASLLRLQQRQPFFKGHLHLGSQLLREELAIPTAGASFGQVNLEHLRRRRSHGRRRRSKPTPAHSKAATDAVGTRRT
mmetsp:Transcript_32765/g.102117  ORF Transcript_32765/g.102117 Transcript_32765/m.102117 type:complete len:158 (+) Transcript_32765:417-890(+)